MQVYINKNDQRIALITSESQDNYIVSVYSSIKSFNLREEPLNRYSLFGEVDYGSIFSILPVDEEGTERGWVLRDIDDSEFNFVVES